MEYKLISVVVAVYNGEKSIAATIQSVLNQDYSYPVECIVVDDGSLDRTADIVQTFKQVRYFYQSNQGPAVARNQGAQLAKGEIIFFTDSDCVPQKDWIKKSIDYFRDDTVGVVAGSYGIMNPESLLARCIHSEIIFRHHVLMPNFPRAFGSYNFAIKKRVFQEVGGFNIQYRYPSGEDNDLSYKLIKTGYKIRFVKDSIVKHFHPVSVKKYLMGQYRHGFWRVRMYLDHPQMSLGDDYTFWKDAVEVLVVALLGISSAVLIINFSIAMKVIFLLLIFLLTVEIYYSYRSSHRLKESIFFSWIMFLRAFARTFGFSSGILSVLLKKKIKKSK